MDSKIIKLLLFFLFPINLYATEFQGNFKQGSFILGKTTSELQKYLLMIKQKLELLKTVISRLELAEIEKIIF